MRPTLLNLRYTIRGVVPTIIEYFHGEFEGYAIAKMYDRNKTDVLAKDMIKLNGWVERAVTHVQRLFRSRI